MDCQCFIIVRNLLVNKLGWNTSTELFSELWREAKKSGNPVFIEFPRPLIHWNGDCANEK